MAAPLAARAQTKISVGALRLTSSGPIFIAIDKGYFREQGLDVELKLFTAAAQPPLAVVSGDVDFAVTGLTASFYNLAAKGGVKIIGAQSREEPGFNLVAYMVTNDAYAKGFRSLKDFAGKSVATTTTGSTFHYSLGKLAQKYGFDVELGRAAPAQCAAGDAGRLQGRSGRRDPGAGQRRARAGEGRGGQDPRLGRRRDAVAARRAVHQPEEHRRAPAAWSKRFVRAYQKAATAYHKAFNSARRVRARSCAARASTR